MPAWCRRRLATLSRRRENPLGGESSGPGLIATRTDAMGCAFQRLVVASRQWRRAFAAYSTFGVSWVIMSVASADGPRNRHRAGPGAATRTSIQAPDGQVTSHDRPPVVDREVRQRTEISEGSVVVDDVEPSVGGARFLSAPVESAITPLALGPIVAAVSVGRRRLARTAPS